MKTLRGFGKEIINGKVSLVVVNELGMVVDVLIKNGDIDDVLTAEKWFAFDKLADDQYLYRMARFINNDGTGHVWGIDSQEIETSHWRMFNF